jgi:hypothetical protein
MRAGDRRRMLAKPRPVRILPRNRCRSRGWGLHRTRFAAWGLQYNTPSQRKGRPHHRSSPSHHQSRLGSPRPRRRCRWCNPSCCRVRSIQAHSLEGLPWRYGHSTVSETVADTSWGLLPGRRRQETGRVYAMQCSRLGTPVKIHPGCRAAYQTGSKGGPTVSSRGLGDQGRSPLR